MDHKKVNNRNPFAEAFEKICNYAAQLFEDMGTDDSQKFSRTQEKTVKPIEPLTTSIPLKLKTPLETATTLTQQLISDIRDMNLITKGRSIPEILDEIGFRLDMIFQMLEKIIQ